MKTQRHDYPSFELSLFCTNDQVFTSAATTIERRDDLPGQDDLLATLDRISDTARWPLSLIVIGLSPFKAGPFAVDEHISNIGTLGAAAKLQHCVLRSNAATAYPDQQTDRHTSLYRLTDRQFAALSIVPATPLALLCESMLSTLDQPLFVGEQPLTTSAHIGIARGHQYRHRPESHLRAAQSALFESRQN